MYINLKSNGKNKTWLVVTSKTFAQTKTVIMVNTRHKTNNTAGLVPFCLGLATAIHDTFPEISDKSKWVVEQLSYLRQNLEGGDVAELLKNNVIIMNLFDVIEAKDEIIDLFCFVFAAYSEQMNERMSMDDYRERMDKLKNVAKSTRRPSRNEVAFLNPVYHLSFNQLEQEIQKHNEYFEEKKLDLLRLSKGAKELWFFSDQALKIMDNKEKLRKAIDPFLDGEMQTKYVSVCSSMKKLETIPALLHMLAARKVMGAQPMIEDILKGRKQGHQMKENEFAQSIQNNDSESETSKIIDDQEKGDKKSTPKTNVGLFTIEKIMVNHIYFACPGNKTDQCGLVSTFNKETKKCKEAMEGKCSANSIPDPLQIVHVVDAGAGNGRLQIDYTIKQTSKILNGKHGLNTMKRHVKTCPIYREEAREIMKNEGLELADAEIPDEIPDVFLPPLYQDRRVRRRMAEDKMPASTNLSKEEKKKQKNEFDKMRRDFLNKILHVFKNEWEDERMMGMKEILIEYQISKINIPVHGDSFMF